MDRSDDNNNKQCTNGLARHCWFLVAVITALIVLIFLLVLNNGNFVEKCIEKEQVTKCVFLITVIIIVALILLYRQVQEYERFVFLRWIMSKHKKGDCLEKLDDKVVKFVSVLLNKEEFSKKTKKNSNNSKQKDKK